MQTQIFSLSIANDLMESLDQFPVSFNKAWEWLGYSRKDNAKRAFLGCGFIEEIDFLTNEELGTLAVPRSGDDFFLTVDCLKSWGMMSGTEQGRKVRKYFLDCERVARSKVVKPDLPTDKLGWMKLAVETEERALEAERRNKALEARIEADAPLVQYAKAVEYSEDSIDFNAFAKMIGTGRTRLFRAMRENGTIMKNSTLPYQCFIEAGYFEVSQEIDDNGRLIPFALVTGKGQIWLHQRLKASAKTQAGMTAAIIASVQQSLEVD